MKYLLLILLFLVNSAKGQIKSFQLYGYQHLNALNLYADQNDSVEKKSYGIFNDSLIKMWDTKRPKSIEEDRQFPTLKITDLDMDFDLKQELKDKVYFVNKTTAMDFYYLENDSTWVHKALRKGIVWEFVKEEYAPIYKIDLGNRRFVYWTNYSGLIFKENGALRTNFDELEYYYKDPYTQISVTRKDSINTDFRYFDYGNYRVELKNYDALFAIDTSYDSYNKHKLIFQRQAADNHLNKDWKYAISKDKKVILDNLNLKYFNKNKLIAVNEDSISFYNSDMRLDSQFHFRTMYKNWFSVEYLVKNEMKKILINDFTLAVPNDPSRFVCGSVEYYKMQIQENNIILSTNGKITNQIPFSKNIKINSAQAIDSMHFMNATKEMDWSDNGGFNNRIIVYKNGKCGLYEFDIKDSHISFSEVLPQAFDKIYLENNFVIVRKKDQEEFLDYYLLKKEMRFIKIYNLGSNFFRYKKNDNTMGWMDPNGGFFNDL